MPLFGGPTRSEMLALARRVSQLEARLEALTKHLGITLPALQDDGHDDIRELALTERMIPAIKLYRERTGAGLKEAKDAVDAFLRGEGPLAS